MSARVEGVAGELEALLPRETVEALREGRGEPAWFAEKRLAAWETARGMPAPEYVRQTYEEKPFWSYLISERERGAVALGDVIVPVDPSEAKGAATLRGGNGVSFQSLDEALDSREDLLKDYFMTDGVRAEENLFAAIHGAAVQTGAVVHVPADCEAEEPLILEMTMGGTSHFDHVLIVAEPNSRVTLVDAIRSSTAVERGYRSGTVEIFAKEGARVSHVGVQDLPYEVSSFTHKRAVVGKDATVEWLDVSFGGSRVKSDVTNFIIGTGGHAEIRGAVLGDRAQLFELSTVTVHEAPMSTGTMVSRGVLTDEARSTYRGLIHIKDEAHGVNSNQDEDTLLLSEEARADAIPILEIDNNDVRCGHAAHMGGMNPEQLFYVATRGLGETEAKLVVVDGFLEPLLRGIPEDRLRDGLKEQVHRRVAA